MMNVYFLCAAAAMAVTCFIHCWFGGKLIAAPLLKARDLHRIPKFTHYYCWHMVSMLLAMMSAAFLWVAMVPDAVDLAFFLVMLASVFALWSLMLVIWKKLRFTEFPQWSLFAVASVIGWLGLVHQIV